MNLDEAIKIIIRDMCGFNDSLFAEAFLCAAYSSDDDLARQGIALDTEVMRTTISSIISKHADATQSLIHARLQSPGEARQLALIHGLDLIPAIHSCCSLCEMPINNFGVAMAVVNSDSEAPKFGDAIEWLLVKGSDVPEEIRAEMNETVDQAFESLGVKPEYNQDGEPIYEIGKIMAALSGNTLH